MASNKKSGSLLIGDKPNSPAHIFDKLLTLLPLEIEKSLQSLLIQKIVEPNTISENIDNQIKEAFIVHKELLNTFSDQAREERVVELQVKGAYPITKGLLAIYVA